MYYMYFVDRVGGRDAFRDAINRSPNGSPENGGVGFADAKLVEAWQHVIDLIDRARSRRTPTRWTRTPPKGERCSTAKRRRCT